MYRDVKKIRTRRYPWIPTDMKKIGGYPHNGYLTNMSTDTRRIFIQRVGYGGATTRTLTALLTSLDMCLGLHYEFRCT